MSGRDKLSDVTAPLAVTPEIREAVATTAITISEAAAALCITNESEYAAAGTFLSTVVNPGIRKAEGLFAPIRNRWKKMIADAKAGEQETVNAQLELCEPLYEAKAAIDKMMKDFQIAERRRKELEVAKTRRLIQEAAESARLAEASELLASDNPTEAARGEEILNEVAGGWVRPAITLPTISATASAPKAQGTATRWLKRYRLIDKTKLKEQYKVADTVAIGKVVVRMGKAAEEEVGAGSIEFFEEPSLASRSIETED